MVFAIADWKYSENIPCHWQTLATVYSKFTGEKTTVYRYGSHWENIGFQGSDPVTDLRSAGYLGLLHLLFFALHAPTLSTQCFSISKHQQNHFPLAVMGLNFTKMVMSAIRSGRLQVSKNRLTSVSVPGTALHVSDRFVLASCKLYVSLWQNFYNIWTSKNCTIHNSHEVLQSNLF